MNHLKPFLKSYRAGGCNLRCVSAGEGAVQGAASPWHWIHIRSLELGPQQLGTCPAGLLSLLVIHTHPEHCRSCHLAWLLNQSPCFHFSGSLDLLSFQDHLLGGHQPLIISPSLPAGSSANPAFFAWRTCFWPGCSDATSGTSRVGRWTK